jgi:hypothetical protein
MKGTVSKGTMTDMTESKHQSLKSSQTEKKQAKMSAEHMTSTKKEILNKALGL